MMQKSEGVRKIANTSSASQAGGIRREEMLNPAKAIADNTGVGRRESVINSQRPMAAPAAGQQEMANRQKMLNPGDPKEGVSRSNFEESKSRATKPGYNPFIPILALALTLFVMVGFQTIQFIKERSALIAVGENQAAAVEESRKVRIQLESIAKSTAQLAAKGNSNAQVIVEQLRKQGITINTDK